MIVNSQFSIFPITIKGLILTVIDTGRFFIVRYEHSRHKCDRHQQDFVTSILDNSSRFQYTGYIFKDYYIVIYIKGGTMKKFLFLVFLLALGGMAFGQVQVSIPIGLTEATGNTLSVPIYIDQFTKSQGVTGYVLTLSFDPTILRPIGFDTVGTRSAPSSSSFLIIMDGQDSINVGKYFVVMASTDTLTGTGMLIKIKCVVLEGDNSHSDLRLPRMIFNEGNPSAVVTNGFFGRPFQPALTSPANSATGLSTSPTLSWHSTVGAVSYHLQVSSNELFTALVVDDSTLTDTSKVAAALPDSTLYYWRVRAKNGAGVSDYSPIWDFATSIVIGINRLGDAVPSSFGLSQNYPNPFNPTTNIEFKIAKQSYVTIEVFDMLGHRINTLVNEVKSPGIYGVTVDGSTLASGTYFYTMKADNFTMSKKLVLMK